MPRADPSRDSLSFSSPARSCCQPYTKLCSGAPTTNPPPPQTTTNDPPPPTTVPHTPSPTTTTTTTTTESEPTPSSVQPEPTESTSRRSGPSHQPTGLPTGPIGTSSTSAALPTTTPNSPDKSSSSRILPIVLGTVLGLGAVIGAAIFFFIRFRKNRRFDSKRPLSFLALSLSDPAGEAESASSNRPITSQPSLRYTPPAAAGLKGNRFSDRSFSEHSGSTTAQFAQWSQDDENAALVGGPGRQQQIMMSEHNEDGYSGLIGARRNSQGVYTREHDLLSDDNGFHRQRPESEQSFIASSMLPLPPNFQRHAQYSPPSQPAGLESQETIGARPVGHPQTSPTLPHQDLAMRELNLGAQSGSTLEGLDREGSIRSGSPGLNYL
ncbi:hypothetical protein BGZ98_006836 [Dissophora globulifera]|nr:hypothetical protein BGZ98_006836 [Dissophora globulifera]